MKSLRTVRENLIEVVNGESQIKLPIPVINPYIYKISEKEIAESAGISQEELSALLRADAVLDEGTGKVIFGKSDNGITSSCAIEWLLKKNSPQSAGEYLMETLPMHSDERLYPHYIRNSIGRRVTLNWRS